GRIPDGHDATPVSCREPPPAGGAKCRAPDFSCVGEDEQLLAGRRIPDCHRLYVAGRGEAPAVGAERYFVRPSRLTTESNRLYAAQALEVIPFPGAAVGGALLEELFGLEQVVLQQLVVGQGNAVEVGTLSLALQGLAQGALRLGLGPQCVFGHLLLSCDED